MPGRSSATEPISEWGVHWPDVRTIDGCEDPLGYPPVSMSRGGCCRAAVPINVCTPRPLWHSIVGSCPGTWAGIVPSSGFPASGSALRHGRDPGSALSTGYRGRIRTHTSLASLTKRHALDWGSTTVADERFGIPKTSQYSARTEGRVTNRSGCRFDEVHCGVCSA